MSTTAVDSGASMSLARRGAVAFGWGVFASVAKIVLTLVVQAALARLLSPSAFGLFAIGMLVVGLAGYFADIGMATSLVQKQQLEEGDIRFVFTMNLVISLTVALLLFVAAGPLASLFEKPEAAPVFRAMAPVFVLNAAASVSVSLLRRSLDYRRIQIAGLVGYVVGFGIVGIGMAWWQGTVAALVAAFAVQSLVTLVVLYAGTRHTLKLAWRTPARDSHLAFGLTVLATNVVNWMVGAVDRLLIGRLFPSAALGMYSAAYNLVHAPVNVLYPNLQSIVFSATARVQGERARLAAAYLELLAGVSVLMLPAFAGVHFLAQPLVLTIYGTAWSPAATFVATFSVMAPFLLIWGVSTPFLWNSGRKSAEVKMQLPFIVVVATAILLASQVSIVAVAWTAALLFVLRTLVMVAMVARALGIPPLAVLTRLAAATTLALWVACWVAAVQGWMAAGTAPMALRLLAGLLVLAVAQLAGLLVAPVWLPQTLRSALWRWRGLPLLGPLVHRLALRRDE